MWKKSTYTKQFHAQTVKLIEEQGLSVRVTRKKLGSHQPTSLIDDCYFQHDMPRGITLPVICIPLFILRILPSCASV